VPVFRDFNDKVGDHFYTVRHSHPVAQPPAPHPADKLHSLPRQTTRSTVLQTRVATFLKAPASLFSPPRSLLQHISSASGMATPPTTSTLPTPQRRIAQPQAGTLSRASLPCSSTPRSCAGACRYTDRGAPRIETTFTRRARRSGMVKPGTLLS
jgi:hypothetical protein